MNRVKRVTSTGNTGVDRDDSRIENGRDSVWKGLESSRGAIVNDALIVRVNKHKQPN